MTTNLMTDETYQTITELAKRFEELMELHDLVSSEFAKFNTNNPGRVFGDMNEDDVKHMASLLESATDVARWGGSYFINEGSYMDRIEDSIGRSRLSDDPSKNLSTKTLRDAVSKYITKHRSDKDIDPAVIDAVFDQAIKPAFEAADPTLRPLGSIEEYKELSEITRLIGEGSAVGRAYDQLVESARNLVSLHEQCADVLGLKLPADLINGEDGEHIENRCKNVRHYWDVLQDYHFTLDLCFRRALDAIDMGDAEDLSEQIDTIKELGDSFLCRHRDQLWVIRDSFDDLEATCRKLKAAIDAGESENVCDLFPKIIDAKQRMLSSFDQLIGSRKTLDDFIAYGKAIELPGFRFVADCSCMLPDESVIAEIVGDESTAKLIREAIDESIFKLRRWSLVALDKDLASLMDGHFSVDVRVRALYDFDYDSNDRSAAHEEYVDFFRELYQMCREAYEYTTDFMEGRSHPDVIQFIENGDRGDRDIEDLLDALG